ncbi:MAG TPA: hypothetical protein VIT92_09940 [Burkholderiaceae bacterium]
MKPRHLLMGAALAITAWFAFFADAPQSEIAEAAPRQAAGSPARAAPRAQAATVPAAQVALLIPRDRLVGASAERQPGALFVTQSWTPPPPPPPPVVNTPPPPPMAPPLPFVYIGKQTSGDKTEIYLARGDQTYIAKDKMVIDGTYRIEAITPQAITFMYLPLAQTQTLNFGGYQ